MACSNHSPAAPVRYLIGVDGGGSGTRIRLAHVSGQTLASAQAGPSALGQGAAQAWRNILGAIDETFRAANVADWKPRECAVGLGLAGAITPSRIDEFLRSQPDFAQFALASDGYTTLLGAHGGKPGAVIAAGTGSIGEALRADDTRTSVGGWGFPVGDEGSGAWLGMQAMRRAQHASDGRAPASPLVQSIMRAAGETRAALLGWCEDAGQREYAALAPLVFDAEESDPWAAQLLSAAARALDDIATTLDPDGALPLVVSGSIGRRLTTRLAPSTRARIVEPAGDAIDGALMLVRQKLDAIETIRDAG
ncbi:MAG TPA: BadF/BadG/BcrA/BcrD ATPase family protein [Casimicrobiaceae bacterium]|nr:BadF/BadG/BcrA/BcrD ATPase family protein [Casimicrobiaceae bacterium]